MIAVATIAAKIGVPPLSSPVTAELMYCSPFGNSVNVGNDGRAHAVDTFPTRWVKYRR